jgi:hypothetical protein
MTKKSKTILIVTIVLAAGVAIAVPVAMHWENKPDFSKMSPRQIREYFDSNEFRDANEQTRDEIRERIGEAMEARMAARAREYFALPEGDDRTAYLDKIIDEMQARRAEFLAGRDPNDPNRPPDANDPNARQRRNFRGRFGRLNPERMRARSEMTSAVVRAQMIQFSQALFTRMQQRGIQGPMMGRPGGR